MPSPSISLASAHTAGAGAPGDEVEVTPAMIDAGVRELAWYEGTAIERPEIAASVYEAMHRARATR